MPIYLVIYAQAYYHTHNLNIKTIHRVIPTTTAKDQLQRALDRCQDLLQSQHYPGYQWELVLKPDNAHLEEMAKKGE